jgi:hypothetical protein
MTAYGIPICYRTADGTKYDARDNYNIDRNTYNEIPRSTLGMTKQVADHYPKENSKYTCLRTKYSYPITNYSYPITKYEYRTVKYTYPVTEYAYQNAKYAYRTIKYDSQKNVKKSPH